MPVTGMPVAGLLVYTGVIDGTPLYVYDDILSNNSPVTSVTVASVPIYSSIHQHAR